jgi:hypothetical protein
MGYLLIGLSSTSAPRVPRGDPRPCAAGRGHCDEPGGPRRYNVRGDLGAGAQNRAARALLRRMNMRQHGRIVGGGAIAGVAGGIVIAIVLLVPVLLRGGEVWPGLKSAAAPVLGARALAPGFDGAAVALGITCHLAVAIVWGIAFALLAAGMSRRATLLFGAFWGLVVWFGMHGIVLPVWHLGALERAPLIPELIAHVAFGLAVAAAYLPFQRPRRYYTPDVSLPVT